MMQAIVRAVLARHQRTPREWAAHYLLERHFSSLQAYLAMYERFVQAWAHAIETASDWPEGHSPATAALGAQTLLYGLVATPAWPHPKARTCRRSSASPPAPSSPACTQRRTSEHHNPGKRPTIAHRAQVS